MAVVLVGVVLYELFTGNIPVRYGSTVSRKRSISRSERPIAFWFWVILQALIAVLFGFGIINL
ncbi:MAG: hypothetical protein JNJ96_08350 [Anaerolineales bacterium]|nr:hypothetical protein [Anaerolineales bacterium]HMR97625.1 hypothetical protein [Anaerolineales bacterium]HNQ93043.1 hypothetical protein [Anaerolineales bacterium]